MKYHFLLFPIFIFSFLIGFFVRPTEVFAACGGSFSCCTVAPQCNCGRNPITNACKCAEELECVNGTESTHSCGTENFSSSCSSYSITPVCDGKTIQNTGCYTLTTCGAGQSYCGGCINNCRNTVSTTCAQHINNECGPGAPTPGPTCTPYCGNHCGQGDGCGGLCGTIHVMTPQPPSTRSVTDGPFYDAVEGINYFRTNNTDGQVTIGVTSHGDPVDYIEYQIFPVDAAGTALVSSGGLDRCDHPWASCGVITVQPNLIDYSMTFRPRTRYYRLRLRQRGSCGTMSAWRNATYRIDGQVTGRVFIDVGGNAAHDGSYGTCVATGATVYTGNSLNVTTSGEGYSAVDGTNTNAASVNAGRYRTWIAYQNAGNPDPGNVQVTPSNLPAGYSVTCPTGGSYTDANSDLGASLLTNGRGGNVLEANIFICAGGSTVPTPTNLSPTSGTNLTSNPIPISWQAGAGGSASDRYDIHVVDANDVATVNAAGPNSVTHCSWAASEGARCSNNQAGTSYNFTPTNGIYIYAYRVRAVNNSCGSQTGTWSPWTYIGTTGYITGNFYLDPNDAATQPTPGALCVSGGGTSLNSPGTGATVTSLGVDGNTRNATIAGTGYSLYTYTWNPGNNTLNFTPGTDGFGRQYILTCPDSGSYSGINSPSSTANFFFRENNLVNDAWFQTRGGSAYAGQTSGLAMQTLIPTAYCTSGVGCIPYLLATNLASGADTAGIALTGGGSIDSTSDAGTSGTNITQRGTQAAAIGTLSTKLQENYDYFYRQFGLGLNPSDDFASSANDAREPTGSPANGKIAYYRNGNMVIQQPWTIASNQKMTVFVNGNLELRDTSDAQQLITVAQGGFLAFIVSGDIIIDTTVGNNNVDNTTTPNIEGVYIADGSIITETVGIAGGGDQPFVGGGTFVGWTSIVLNRDYNDGGLRRAENNDKAIETFIFRPDFVLNAPEAMMRSSYIWQETN